MAFCFVGFWAMIKISEPGKMILLLLVVVPNPMLTANSQEELMSCNLP